MVPADPRNPWAFLHVIQDFRKYIQSIDLLEDVLQGVRLELRAGRERVLRLKSHRANGIADLMSDATEHPAEGR